MAHMEDTSVRDGQWELAESLETELSEAALPAGQVSDPTDPSLMDLAQATKTLLSGIKATPFAYDDLAPLLVLRFLPDVYPTTSGTVKAFQHAVNAKFVLKYGHGWTEKWIGVANQFLAKFTKLADEKAAALQKRLVAHYGKRWMQAHPLAQDASAAPPAASTPTGAAPAAADPNASSAGVLVPIGPPEKHAKLYSKHSPEQVMLLLTRSLVSQFAKGVLPGKKKDIDQAVTDALCAYLGVDEDKMGDLVLDYSVAFDKVMPGDEAAVVEKAHEALSRAYGTPQWAKKHPAYAKLFGGTGIPLGTPAAAPAVAPSPPAAKPAVSAPKPPPAAAPPPAPAPAVAAPKVPPAPAASPAAAPPAAVAPAAPTAAPAVALPMAAVDTPALKKIAALNMPAATWGAVRALYAAPNRTLDVNQLTQHLSSMGVTADQASAALDSLKQLSYAEHGVYVQRDTTADPVTYRLKTLLDKEPAPEGWSLPMVPESDPRLALALADTDFNPPVIHALRAILAAPGMKLTQDQLAKHVAAAFSYIPPKSFGADVASRLFDVSKSKHGIDLEVEGSFAKGTGVFSILSASPAPAAVAPAAAPAPPAAAPPAPAPAAAPPPAPEPVDPDSEPNDSQALKAILAKLVDPKERRAVRILFNAPKQTLTWDDFKAALKKKYGVASHEVLPYQYALNVKPEDLDKYGYFTTKLGSIRLFTSLDNAQPADPLDVELAAAWKMTQVDISGSGGLIPIASAEDPAYKELEAKLTGDASLYSRWALRVILGAGKYGITQLKLKAAIQAAFPLALSTPKKLKAGGKVEMVPETFSSIAGYLQATGTVSLVANQGYAWIATNMISEVPDILPLAPSNTPELKKAFQSLVTVANSAPVIELIRVLWAAPDHTLPASKVADHFAVKYQGALATAANILKSMPSSVSGLVAKIDLQGDMSLQPLASAQPAAAAAPAPSTEPSPAGGNLSASEQAAWNEFDAYADTVFSGAPMGGLTSRQAMLALIAYMIPNHEALLAAAKTVATEATVKAVWTSAKNLHPGLYFSSVFIKLAQIMLPVYGQQPFKKPEVVAYLKPALTQGPALTTPATQASNPAMPPMADKDSPEVLAAMQAEPTTVLDSPEGSFLRMLAHKSTVDLPARVLHTLFMQAGQDAQNANLSTTSALIGLGTVIRTKLVKTQDGLLDLDASTARMLTMAQIKKNSAVVAAAAGVPLSNITPAAQVNLVAQFPDYAAFVDYMKNDATPVLLATVASLGGVTAFQKFFASANTTGPGTAWLPPVDGSNEASKKLAAWYQLRFQAADLPAPQVHPDDAALGLLFLHTIPVVYPALYSPANRDAVDAYLQAKYPGINFGGAAYPKAAQITKSDPVFKIVQDHALPLTKLPWVGKYIPAQASATDTEPADQGLVPAVAVTKVGGNVFKAAALLAYPQLVAAFAQRYYALYVGDTAAQLPPGGYKPATTAAEAAVKSYLLSIFGYSNVQALTSEIIALRDTMKSGGFSADTYPGNAYKYVTQYIGSDPWFEGITAVKAKLPTAKGAHPPAAPVAGDLSASVHNFLTTLLAPATPVFPQYFSGEDFAYVANAIVAEMKWKQKYGTKETYIAHLKAKLGNDYKVKRDADVNAITAAMVAGTSTPLASANGTLYRELADFLTDSYGVDWFETHPLVADLAKPPVANANPVAVTFPMPPDLLGHYTVEQALLMMAYSEIKLAMGYQYGAAVAAKVEDAILTHTGTQGYAKSQQMSLSSRFYAAMGLASADKVPMYALGILRVAYGGGKLWFNHHPLLGPLTGVQVAAGGPAATPTPNNAAPAPVNAPAVTTPGVTSPPPGAHPALPASAYQIQGKPVDPTLMHLLNCLYTVGDMLQAGGYQVANDFAETLRTLVAIKLGVGSTEVYQGITDFRQVMKAAVPGVNTVDACFKLFKQAAGPAIVDIVKYKWIARAMEGKFAALKRVTAQGGHDAAYLDKDYGPYNPLMTDIAMNLGPIAASLSAAFPTTTISLGDIVQLILDKVLKPGFGVSSYSDYASKLSAAVQILTIANPGQGTTSLYGKVQSNFKDIYGDSPDWAKNIAVLAPVIQELENSVASAPAQGSQASGNPPAAPAPGPQPANPQTDASGIIPPADIPATILAQYGVPKVCLALCVNPAAAMLAGLYKQNFAQARILVFTAFSDHFGISFGDLAEIHTKAMEALPDDKRGDIIAKAFTAVQNAKYGSTGVTWVLGLPKIKEAIAAWGPNPFATNPVLPLGSVLGLPLAWRDKFTGYDQDAALWFAAADKMADVLQMSNLVTAMPDEGGPSLAMKLARNVMVRAGEMLYGIPYTEGTKLYLESLDLPDNTRIAAMQGVLQTYASGSLALGFSKKIQRIPAVIAALHMIPPEYNGYTPTAANLSASSMELGGSQEAGALLKCHKLIAAALAVHFNKPVIHARVAFLSWLKARYQVDSSQIDTWLAQPVLASGVYTDITALPAGSDLFSILGPFIEKCSPGTAATKWVTGHGAPETSEWVKKIPGIQSFIDASAAPTNNTPMPTPAPTTPATEPELPPEPTSFPHTQGTKYNKSKPINGSKGPNSPYAWFAMYRSSAGRDVIHAMFTLDMIANALHAAQTTNFAHKEIKTALMKRLSKLLGMPGVKGILKNMIQPSAKRFTTDLGINKVGLATHSRERLFMAYGKPAMNSKDEVFLNLPFFSYICKQLGLNEVPDSGAGALNLAKNNPAAGPVGPQPMVPTAPQQAPIAPQPAAAAPIVAPVATPVAPPPPLPLVTGGSTDLPDVDLPDEEELQEVPGGANGLAGAGQKKVLVDSNGKGYLFKLGVSHEGTGVIQASAVVAQVFFGKVAQVVKPNSPVVGAVDFAGTLGTLQPLIGDPQNAAATQPLSLAGVDPAALTPQQRKDVATEHVLDWLMSNHATSADKLVMTADGGVVGIDKDQCFKFFGGASPDKPEKLDLSYDPGGAPGGVFYHKFWTDWTQGKVDFDPASLAGTIAAIEGIRDEDFIEEIELLAQTLYPEDTIKMMQVVEAALERKQRIRADFEAFFTEVYKQKTGNTGTFTFAGGWVDLPAKITGANAPPVTTTTTTTAKNAVSQQGLELKTLSTDPKLAQQALPNGLTLGELVSIQLPFNSSGAEAKLMAFCAEYGLTPIGPSFKGSYNLKILVRKDQFEAAQSTKTTTTYPSEKFLIVPANLSATNPSPPYPPVNLNTIQQLDDLPNQVLGITGRNYSSDGAHVEGNEVFSRRWVDQSGEFYYLVSFKLRPHSYENLSGGQSATYTPKAGIYKSSKDAIEVQGDGSSSYSFSAQKWSIGKSALWLANDSDSRFAWNGTVVAHIYVDAGSKVSQVLVALLDKMRAGMGATVFANPTPEELEIGKLSQLIWALDPAQSGNLPPENQRTLADMRSRVAGLGLPKALTDQVRLSQVDKGHFAWELPGRWKTFRDNYNFRFLFGGTGSAAGVVGVLSSAWLSTRDRVLSGLLPSAAGGGSIGASPTADLASGGASFTFLRAMFSNSSDFGGGVSGDYKFIIAPDLIDRLDIFGYKHDSYGNCKSSDYESRKPVDALMKYLGTSGNVGSSELMVKGSVPVSRILGIAVDGNPSSLRSALKSAGMMQINGVAVDSFVQQASTPTKADSLFVKPRGY